MKYIAIATEELYGTRLADEITEAGGVVVKRYDVMPEVVVFEPGGNTDQYWIHEFKSDYLKKLSRDQVVTIPEVTEPLEQPLDDKVLLASGENKTPGWHLEAIDKGMIFPDIPQKPVDVYVLDTGVSSHSDFKSINYVPEVHTDVHGHGTHVAGLVASKIYGVNQGLVNVNSVKVLGDTGSGTMTMLVDGMLSALEHYKSHDRPGIVNMSLSARGLITAMPTYDVLTKMQEAGMMFVVAAGNRGESLDHDGELPDHTTGIDTWPAEQPGVLCVASVVQGHQGKYWLSPFSNYGGNCRINAPGSFITSTYRNNGYAMMSGTSMASPIVAGALALRMTGTDKRPETAEEAKKYIDQFITVFSSPDTNTFKMHTDKLLDLSFINVPDTWVGDPQEEEPDTPQEIPVEEPNEEETSDKKLLVFFGVVALVILTLVLTV